MSNIKSLRIANRFLALIEKGILRKETSIYMESTEAYSISQEAKDFKRYNCFVNSSSFDSFRAVKVKRYLGDNY